MIFFEKKTVVVRARVGPPGGTFSLLLTVFPQSLYRHLAPLMASGSLPEQFGDDVASLLCSLRSFFSALRINFDVISEPPGLRKHGNS